MTSADHGRGDQLNDQLDARAAGTPLPARAVDPITAETVRRFFSRDDAPPPPRILVPSAANRDTAREREHMKPMPAEDVRPGRGPDSSISVEPQR